MFNTYLAPLCGTFKNLSVDPLSRVFEPLCLCFGTFIWNSSEIWNVEPFKYGSEPFVWNLIEPEPVLGTCVEPETFSAEPLSGTFVESGTF